jgi:hypothetical protein
MSVTLLSMNKQDPTYSDYNANDTDNVRVVYFDGQLKHKRNGWIMVGSILIEKVGTKWVYVGIVVFVQEVEPRDGVARFLLVVEKNNFTGHTSRTKKLLMEQLGWILTDESQGIANVTHV